MKSNFKQITGISVLSLSVFLIGAGCDNSSQSNSTAQGTNAPMMGSDSNSMGTNSVATNADNTGRNKRDQTNQNVTPPDQGNSEADLSITQKIRQNVVSSTNNFSVDAKNVKIITVGGKVTLRGPVNNDAEKSAVESIAKSVAGDGNVDDQLEVKAQQ